MADSFKQPAPPQDFDLLQALKRETMTELNAVQIGIVQTFDPAKQTASVQIAIKRVTSTAPNGDQTFISRPVLLSVPVFFLYGGASFISLPIQPGDNCIVLFNDRDIDNWFNTGEISAPNTPRVHDASDAIAIIGIKNMQTAISNYLADGIRLFRNANSKIDIKDDLIDSIAELFYHHGDMRISGDLTIDGVTRGDGAGDWKVHANIRQDAAHSIHAGNGFTGTIGSVNFVDGIAVI